MPKNVQITIHLFVFHMPLMFISVTRSCPILCNPMDCNMPGFPIHHQLLEFTQIHVHGVGDAIQPSHPLSSSSPPAFILSQNRGLFKRVSSSHNGSKVLEFKPQHQSLQRIFRNDFVRMDWLDLRVVSQESSPTPQFKASILRHTAFFIVQLSHPYMTTGKTIALTR